MIELCGNEERITVFLGTDHHYDRVTNDLVGRVNGMHLYCDLTAKEKQLEVRADSETVTEYWPLEEILAAGIRAMKGDL
jgi:hypothetical protein